jgi:hypothetical protein
LDSFPPFATWKDLFFFFNKANTNTSPGHLPVLGTTLLSLIHCLTWLLCYILRILTKRCLLKEVPLFQKFTPFSIFSYSSASFIF